MRQRTHDVTVTRTTSRQREWRTREADPISLRYLNVSATVCRSIDRKRVMTHTRPSTYRTQQMRQRTHDVTVTRTTSRRREWRTRETNPISVCVRALKNVTWRMSTVRRYRGGNEEIKGAGMPISKDASSITCYRGSEHFIGAKKSSITSL
jgi:hypothetical protein